MLTAHLSLKTKGNTDIIDITGKVREQLENSGLKEGQITLFVSGSTGSLTTMEFEPNLVKDLKDAFERIAPENMEYAHHITWGDHNGHSHIRASLLGPSLTIPFIRKELTLGTWQQIVFIDFDASARTRELLLQITGI
ncbi:MAG: secondary thiamine-phosphate synthase enzyme YjbQ [Candidatus Omnitrophota bacterium]|nr:secondary thiamine-phosphate synthase enzyme YjbQ [Candidatus Omnitrophota bacterium]